MNVPTAFYDSGAEVGVDGTIGYIGVHILRVATTCISMLLCIGKVHKDRPVEESSPAAIVRRQN